MKQAYDGFELLIREVRGSFGVLVYLEKTNTAALNLDEFRRGLFASTIAALDFFVHEITIQGMLKIYDKQLLPTQQFLSFKIAISNYDFVNGNLPRQQFEASLRETFSYLSFQQPDKIADAIRLFAPFNIWEEVNHPNFQDQKSLKRQLKLTVARRNQIVHEGDLKPMYPFERWPIDTQELITTIDFVQNVATAIYDVMKTKGIT